MRIMTNGCHKLLNKKLEIMIWGFFFRNVDEHLKSQQQIWLLGQRFHGRPGVIKCVLGQLGSSPSDHKQPIGPQTYPTISTLKYYVHCSYDLKKFLRREGLSNILLKELPLEGYICEKYSKIGRYIALEKFKLNSILMERTKARFEWKHFWKGKSCTK